MWFGGAQRNAHGRKTLPVRSLLEMDSPGGGSCYTYAFAHRGEAVRVRFVQETLPHVVELSRAQANAHRRPKSSVRSL